MSASFSTIVGRVLLRCPMAGRFLAEDWVRTAWEELSDSRRWSWLYGYGQFLVPESYDTGTVTVTRNSAVVTGSSTVWDNSLIGRQFRIAGKPIYTIASVESATSLTLDTVYGGSTASAQTYEIYQCYFTAPDDFQSFISVYDPSFNWQLVTDFSQNILNAADAQRANSGNAYLVAWYDYSASQIGTVAQPLQVVGTGNDPGSSGTYTGPANAIFTVEITPSGAPGTAIYKWKKDSGSYTSGVTSNALGSAEALQDGVSIYFPLAVSYTSGDTFVIRVTAGSNAGRPRFEVYPHQKSEYLYPFLYWKKPADISVSGVTIPYLIENTLLIERALSKAASWPGPSPDKPNPYYRLELSDRHFKNSERMLMDAERNDEEVFLSNVQYQEATSLPFAVIPALGDVNWLQKHDL